jgi:acyl carrier protein
MAEEHIAEIWHNLLGIYPIGVNDDFFDLGGDSLLATTLVSELAKKFNQTISLQNLFENATVAQLAEIFQAKDVSEIEEDYEEGQL